MKLIKLATLATLLAVGSYISTAMAGAAQYEDLAMHCVILKNNKVVHKQNCIADGYEHGGAAYGGGLGYTFNKIKGYGTISVESSSTVITDKNGNPVTDSRGYNEMKTSNKINNKDATLHFRDKKTFKINQDGDGYRCYTQKKNPKYEFCFIER